MKIKIGNVVSNDSVERFKNIVIINKQGSHSTTFNDGAVDCRLNLPPSSGLMEQADEDIITIGEDYILKKHFDAPTPFGNMNLPGQIPYIATINSLDSWCGDPQHCLYNPAEKLYYMWSIGRYGKSFNSDWFEWTSTDLRSWKQNAIRLNRQELLGSSNNSFNGGSVVVSRGGAGFPPKGHLMFFVSMGAGAWTDDRGHKASDQCTAVFLAEGFNKPIYQKWIVAENFIGGDFRDCYAYYVSGSNDPNPLLYCAIASGRNSSDSRYNGGLVMSHIKSLEFDDWEKNIQFIKSQPYGGQAVDYGVEVPNVIKLSSKDEQGNNLWFIGYSDQSLKGESVKPEGYQTCKGWIMRRVGDQFTEEGVQNNRKVFDYGNTCYARRFSDPMSDIKQDGCSQVFSNAMLFNWYYQDALNFTKGKTSFTCGEIFYFNNEGIQVGCCQTDYVKYYKAGYFFDTKNLNGVYVNYSADKKRFFFEYQNKPGWDWNTSVLNMYAYREDDDILVYQCDNYIQFMNLTSGQTASFIR